MESSRPGVKVWRAGLVGVFEGSNGGRCGCHKRFGDSYLGQHSVSLGVQEGGLASARAPGSPGEFCCWPREELGSQGLFGVQLGSLVQGSGATP